ncbi:hypothetical protein L9F63_012922, partial [Diploptera punctata]
IMEVQEKPIFMPPKKRTSGKKFCSANNHVDHIMTVQAKDKISFESPSVDSFQSEMNNVAENGTVASEVILEDYKETNNVKHTTSCDIKSSDYSPVIENGHTSGILNSTSAVALHQPEQASTNTSLSQSENSLDMDLIRESGSKKGKAKKKVNICTDREDLEEEETCSNIETTALRRGSETSDSVADHSGVSGSTDGCLTMTGTIKRGKKAGQSVDVRLNMSREELEVLEAVIAAKRRNSTSPSSLFACGPTKGPHITMWTALCLPFAFAVSGIYSFYMGTITCWYKEITDLEKGFYGWLCALLKHEDCAPYEVVVLTDIQPPAEGEKAC